MPKGMKNGVIYWECEGMAARPSAGHSEPTPCLCMKHGVLMEDGDHSACPVELLACPEHAFEEVQPTGDAIAFTDKAGRPTVGFASGAIGTSTSWKRSMSITTGSHVRNFRKQ